MKNVNKTLAYRENMGIPFKELENYVPHTVKKWKWSFGLLKEWTFGETK